MKFRSYYFSMALAASLVLAPQAAAATPEMDPVTGGFPIEAIATTSGGNLTTVGGSSVTCTSGGGSGLVTSATTGEGSYTLNGCNTGGLACTSPGQTNGTIKLATMIMHLVYLDENRTKPGVLATPPASGIFAEFTCAFGLYKVQIEGNGVLGEIFSPKCGQTSKSATVGLSTVEQGKQKYMQVEETGTVYDLTAVVNGTPETAGLTVAISGLSAREATLTCPEQK